MSTEDLSMDTEHAIRIAELWAEGKMIGGDEGDVRNALLAEVKRLRAAISAIQPRADSK